MKSLINGLTYGSKEDFIEKVSINGLTVRLMASYDGTEVIHHTLKSGSKWVVKPSDGWDALEFIQVLNGKMSFQIHSGTYSIHAGEHIIAMPIKEACFFTALTDTEFLYISSQPVFHHYSHLIKKFKHLAVSVEEKDGYTAEHCTRIMELSYLVGEKLGLGSLDLHRLNIGAFLHDLGKVNIPDSILNKPGKLTDSEWLIMRTHPSQGRKMMEDSGLPSLKEAALIVEQHHERFNGSGYPYGLKKDEILLPSSIVAVVDSYDAMTTDRIYRKGKSKEEAMTEIHNEKERLYHPDVVDAFLSIDMNLL